MDQPVLFMIYDLEKSFDIHFDYDPNSVILSNKIATKLFNNNTLDEVMEDLLLGTGLHYKVSDENIVIIRPEDEAIITKKDLIPTHFNFHLTGTIKDNATGESLPYASVVVKGTEIGSLTNPDGFFTISNVPSDTSTLVIQHLGYKTISVKLRPEIAHQQMELELTSFASELSEIVIQGSKEEQMTSVSENISQVSLSPSQVAALPAVGEKDLLRSLQLMPGVIGTNEVSSGLYVRGGTPDQNLMLLDGFTVYHVDHFYGFFSPFNTAAIKDVQLYKGGFEAKYGGRTSSVIEMTGKTGNANDINANVGISTLNTSASIELPLGDNATFFLAGRRSYTDLIQSNLYKNVFDLFNNEVNFEIPDLGVYSESYVDRETNPVFYYYDLNAKLTITPSKKDIISLSVYNGQDKLDNSNTVITYYLQDTSVNTINNYTKDITDWGNFGSSLRWGRQWNPLFYSNVVVAFSKYNSDRDRTSIIDYGNTSTDSTTSTISGGIESNEVEDFNLRFDNEYLYSKKHKLEFGIQLTRNSIYYNYSNNDTTTLLNRNDKGMQIAAYVQDTWSILEKLKLKLGFRSTYFDVTGQFYQEPRASIFYQLNDKIKLKASWGKYFQFTNRIVRDDITQGSRDFWLLSNNESNTVSSAMHYIAGFSYETADFLFDAEFYQKNLQGLSEFTLQYEEAREGTTYDQLFYEGTGIARGLEMLVQKKIGKYSGWISYTLSEVVHNFPDLSSTSYYALHDQRHETKIVNTVKLGFWTISGTWVYGTGKPFTAPNGDYSLDLPDGSKIKYLGTGQKNALRLPAYHRLDISVSADVAFSPKTKLNAGISFFNVYNRKNIWYKEFEVSNNEIIENNVTLIGFIPSLFLNLNFR